MIYLILSFILSFLICIVLIRLNAFHDVQEGVQKFHDSPTPRVGGFAVYLSLIIISLIFFMVNKPFAKEYFFLLVSALPVFISGLLEDITGKVSPKWRLIAGFFSGILAFFLISASINRVDILFLDSLLKFLPFSLLFTSFALAGVGHAFNIIDGFNGLASGVAILVFGAYAYVSFLHNDFFLLYVSLTFLAATLGFFLWNYPFGLIFLGDGGAYLLGFASGLIGVLLVNRHPDVSPWFPLLLVIYPVWETLFSIYRRKFLKNYPPHMPDALHFHQLIYRRLIKFTFGKEIEPLKRNSYTSPFLWFIELICIIPAVLFWGNTKVLILSVLVFIFLYTWLYFRIVKFKTPKILIRKV